jgi:hypothetical protein
MKDSFFAWAAGSRGFIGTHIARLELMHATCMFCRAYWDARVVFTMTEESMECRDFFVTVPYGGKCEITFR